jgi:hypothetical protein
MGVGVASAFSLSTHQSSERRKYTVLEVRDSSTQKITFSLAAPILAAVVIFTASPVLASEIGVEVEAPTFTTGETVEVRYRREIYHRHELFAIVKK